jgi:hypothetical protein
MLNIEVNRSAEGVERYFDRELAVSGYLMDGPGIWAGRGAERLGLHGAVQRSQFVALLRNENPATVKRLAARMNTSRQEGGGTVSNRQVGYGLVFGVPKSLSIYLPTTGDPVVENIARAAVDGTMRAMESEMQCKVRKGGLHENRTTGELLYSKFFHRDSRPIGGLSDPHWHVHCFLHNSTFDPVEHRMESGPIQGADRRQRLRKTGFRPILYALAVFFFLVNWNAFLWPLTITTNQKPLARTTCDCKFPKSIFRRLELYYGCIGGGRGANACTLLRVPTPVGRINQDFRH